MVSDTGQKFPRHYGNMDRVRILHVTVITLRTAMFEELRNSPLYGT